jgi:cell wall-associated NlpC family hydrolase
VKFVLSLLQLELPRTARGQSLVGMPVERDTARLRPGDLVTFGPGKRVTHIGIYVGDGRIVHASVGQRAVVEATMTSRGSWFARHWLGARRLLALADSTH